MLSHGHPPSQLTKGWNKHLFFVIQRTNILTILLYDGGSCVASNKDKNVVQELILNRLSSPLNRTVPSATIDIAPLSTVPPPILMMYLTLQSKIMMQLL